MDKDIFYLSSNKYINQLKNDKSTKMIMKNIDDFINNVKVRNITLLAKDYRKIVNLLPPDIAIQILDNFIYREVKINWLDLPRNIEKHN